MEKPQLQLISTAAYAPVSGEKTTPFSQQSVVLTKQDYIALKWEANYWRAQHARLVQREAALRGKRVAGLPPEAYGGYKDVNEAWAAGVLVVRGGPAAVGGEVLAVPTHLREPWAERVAIMVTDGGLPREEAERLAWAGLQAPGAVP